MTTDGKPLRLKDGALAALMGALAEASRYGSPMREAVGVCRRGASDRRVRDVLSALEERMAAGQSFAQAVGAHPPLLPPFYVHIIEAADANGAVPEALARLRDYARQRQRIGRAFASVWQLWLGVMIVFLVLLVSLTLQWTETSKTERDLYPELSSQQYETSEFPVRSFVIGVAVALSLLPLMIFGLQRKRWGAYLLESVRLLIPVLRGMTLNAAAARFGQSLGLSLWAGLPEAEALDWASAECGSPVLRGQLGVPRARLSEGTPLLDALSLSSMLAAPTLWMNGLVAETASALQSMADVKEQEIRRGMELACAALVGILVPLIYFLYYFLPGKDLHHWI
ncbi:MAG: type II secretion system F family protein [Candidatus Hydrogenedentales bacterium]|jgi:type II secretory pathway component PulF